MSHPRHPRRTLAHALFGGYLLVCLLSLVWPGYAWVVERLDHRILGLPFSLGWIVVWALGTFLALVLYDAATKGEERS